MQRSASLKYLVVLIAGLMLWGCSKKATSIVDSTIPQRDVSTTQGGLPSEYTNCLSLPVVWAEGHGLTGEDVSHFTGLRGNIGDAIFTTPYTTIDGVDLYQNPSVNQWQAEWVDGTTLGEVGVEVDWADNMTRQTWTVRSKVRVEVVMFENLATPLKAFSMQSLGGISLNEIFVTDATTYASSLATVYSNVARLKIEKLEAQNGTPTDVVYNSVVSDAYFVDGPVDAYSAEVNMGGKCIYGFNWDVRTVDLPVKSGWYRLSFILDAGGTVTDVDGVVQTYTRNTKLESLNPLDLFGATVPEVVLYQPTLSDYASTLDIYIKAK